MEYPNKELIDLEKGTIYTTESLVRLIHNKENTFILCEDTHFFPAEDPSTRFLVKKKMETFVHRMDEDSHSIATSKQHIYFVKKCKSK